jgi:uncharacterized protein YkwD
MNRLSVRLASLAAFCLLIASCSARPADDPAPPTLSAEPTATSARAPTLSLTATSTSMPTPTLPPTVPPSPVPQSIDHAVQPGDTLLGLAQQYGVPMAAIQLSNGMADSTVLHAGDTLSIPAQADWEGASPFWVVHVVEPGETLIGIAHTHDLQVTILQEVNDLANAARLQIGEQLVLPLSAPVAAVVPTPTPPPPPPTQPPSPTTAPPAAVPAAAPAPPPSDVAAWPHEVARLINDIRAVHGLPAMVYDEALALAAQGQANDCAQRGWCSHTGSDGSDVRTRVLRAGYDAAGWAECWAWAATPQSTIDMWMDEEPPNDPHRRTLLSTWVTEIGVGVAQSSRWGYFFIADFGRPGG